MPASAFHHLLKSSCWLFEHYRHPHMSNSTSPLTWYWVDRTFNSRFNSRSYAETLLRPDLESGLITQHDFNLATTYLPGYQRFYPVCAFFFGYASSSFSSACLVHIRAGWNSCLRNSKGTEATETKAESYKYNARRPAWSFMYIRGLRTWGGPSFSQPL